MDVGAHSSHEDGSLPVSHGILKAAEISKSYQGRRVVDGVSVSVQTGEVVGLLGPNGAGKTTSFYMIVGLITPDAGRIFLEDRDITALAMYERARVGISYLPQEPSVFRKLSVEENLMAILETQLAQRAPAPPEVWIMLDRPARPRQGPPQPGLHAVGRRAAQGGNCAFPGHPIRSFLLLDEPFSGIDPIQVLELQKHHFRPEASVASGSW